MTVVHAGQEALGPAPGPVGQGRDHGGDGPAEIHQAQGAVDFDAGGADHLRHAAGRDVAHGLHLGEPEMGVHDAQSGREGPPRTTPRCSAPGGWSHRMSTAARSARPRSGIMASRSAVETGWGGPNRTARANRPGGVGELSEFLHGRGNAASGARCLPCDPSFDIDVPSGSGIAFGVLLPSAVLHGRGPLGH